MMLPRIRCALCGHRVELVECWRDERDLTLQLRVCCHGDSDSMELPLRDLADFDLVEQLRGQEGVAFATPRLDPPAGRFPATQPGENPCRTQP
jgi:hypothetical protein